MADIKILDEFREQMRGVDRWFQQQNENEKTTVIYALLRHCSPLQIRFFLTVLQSMAKKDPIAEILSPRGSILAQDADAAEEQASNRLFEKLTQAEVREQESSRRLYDPFSQDGDEGQTGTRPTVNVYESSNI